MLRALTPISPCSNMQKLSFSLIPEEQPSSNTFKRGGKYSNYVRNPFAKGTVCSRDVSMASPCVFRPLLVAGAPESRPNQQHKWWRAMRATYHQRNPPPTTPCPQVHFEGIKLCVYWILLGAFFFIPDPHRSRGLRCVIDCWFFFSGILVASGGSWVSISN